jgi:hypothetical protein
MSLKWCFGAATYLSIMPHVVEALRATMTDPYKVTARSLPFSGSVHAQKHINTHDSEKIKPHKNSGLKIC